MIEFPITLTSGGSVCLLGHASALALGYAKNKSVYRLNVTASGEWEGLTIRCFWHVPDGKDPVSSLIIDGFVAVPASVTAQPGSGCVTFEGSDGTKTVTSADLRYRVSANSGTEDGTEPEPGTPAWQQLVDAVHTDATAAEQAKADAQNAARQAGSSAQKAGQALSDTVTAKEAALKAIGDKQTAATQAVDTALDKALQQVEASTEAAQTAASEAATSAGNADQSAQAAAGSLQALKDGIANGNFKGEQGPQGPIGPVGPQGEQGPQGPKGETGPAVALDTTLTHEGEAAQAKSTGDAISAVKERQNILVGSEIGNPISVDDAFPAPLCGLTVYGRSTQDGTPTPDAPVPIVSAGESGSVAVKVTGANVLEGTAPGGQVSQFGATYTVNENGVLVTGTATSNSSFYLHKDKTPRLTHGTYYLTTKGLSASVVLNFFYVGKITSDVQNLQVMLTKDVEYSLVLQLQKGVTANTTVQVSLTRNTITAYFPYREQLLTLPTPTGLLGIPVTSGGNYTDPQGQQWVCDEVDLGRGVKVQRVKVLNLLDVSGFDNNGTWHITTKQFGAGTSYIPMAWYDSITKCLCTTFPVQMTSYSTGSNADLSLYYSETGDTISLKSALFNPKGQSATVDEAKAWFTAHPTYLYVPIEPIETPLTPDEIAAYKALTAYGPDTVVQAGDGAGVKLEYQRDVNIAIKKLEDAVASMT